MNEEDFILFLIQNCYKKQGKSFLMHPETIQDKVNLKEISQKTYEDFVKKIKEMLFEKKIEMEKGLFDETLYILFVKITLLE